jgi:hypothetical protein
MLKTLSSAMLLVALAATAGSSVAASSPDLSLSFPLAHEKQRFAYFTAKSHFHVLLTNRSDRSQRVWEGWNSWGYYSLSFEITDSAGKTWHVGRKPTAFTKNYASYWTLASGDTLVTDIYFGDPSEWDGFPLRKGEENTVRMRAVFEVAQSPESAKYAVWTGRIESNEVEATFVR